MRASAETRNNPSVNPLNPSARLRILCVITHNYGLERIWLGLNDVPFIDADRQGMGGGQAAQLATDKALKHVSSIVESYAAKHAA